MGVRELLSTLIEAGLREDRARQDVTTQALFPDPTSRVLGRVQVEEAGVFCGGPAAIQVFRELDPSAREVERIAEGTAVQPGDTALTVEAGVEAILAGERTALNLLAHLSGIASRTRKWTALAAPVRVLDTRKTWPGLRLLQKFAVRAGGGENHRQHLAEFPMVKENHRKLFRERFLGGATEPRQEIAELVKRLRAAAPGSPIEVEVEDQESFLACLLEGVDLVLLDNQTPEQISAWIRASDAGSLSQVELEASGGIHQENLRSFAVCGVHKVSLGALTHSVTALNLSMDVNWLQRHGDPSPEVSGKDD